MNYWSQWLADHGVWLTGLGVLSLATFVGSLIMLPVLVTRMRCDYFVRAERGASPVRRVHPVIGAALQIGRNALGFLLVLAGLAMLVLPGQGILTLLIGLSLTDFPGKYRLERWLVMRPGVLKAINWIRVRAGGDPLIQPDGRARR